MTDLEIMKLCAEAMELPHAATGTEVYLMNSPTHTYNGKYDPITNDAQAMALVKRFGLRIDCDDLASQKGFRWHAQAFDYAASKWHLPAYADNDLNHAICEVVAKLHQAKSTG